MLRTLGKIDEHDLRLLNMDGVVEEDDQRLIRVLTGLQMKKERMRRGAVAGSIKIC